MIIAAGKLVQWCSVVKYGMSGPVRSSHQMFQITPTWLRQWFPNTQQSRFLAACI